MDIFILEYIYGSEEDVVKGLVVPFKHPGNSKRNRNKHLFIDP